ncbi:hypothetical protein Tco_1525742, partial [Tanacetum coccineum]
MATPSPRSVCTILHDLWCRVVILFVSSANEPKSCVFPPNAIQLEKGCFKDKLVYTPKPKGRVLEEHSTKDDACHHYKKVGCWKSNCLVYLAELMMKKKNTGSTSTSGLRGEKQGLRGERKLKQGTVYDYALESATRILNMVPTKKVDKTQYELWYGKLPNLSYLKVCGCEALVKRDTLDKLQQRSVKCIFVGYPKETIGYYFYFSHDNKIVVASYVEFLEKNLISQEAKWERVKLEEIQDEDTSSSENTSEIPVVVEGFEPPQEDEDLVRRPVRTHQAPERLWLNVEVEEHSLRD